MSEQAIEQQIQDKGLNAPRLTPRHIDAVIVEEHYFTAEDGATNAPPDMCNRGEFPHLAQITFCVLILKNGYKITGVNHSSVSPENHDLEMGRKLAYEDARNKIWQLEGYLLKQKLYEQSKPTTFQERVISEQIELQSKLDALNALLVKGQPEFIDDKNWQLLNEQHKHMSEYNVTLLQRIGLFEA